MGELTYSSLMGCVIDSAGLRPRLPYPITVAECPMEAPTGGSGRGGQRGPVGELNLHGTCARPFDAPVLRCPTQHGPGRAPDCSYALLRQMVSQWAERQSVLAFALADLSRDTCYRVSNALTVPMLPSGLTG
jgi:hypothetical protein